MNETKTLIIHDSRYPEIEIINELNKREWSQAKLGRIAGYHRMNIKRWLDGQNPMKFEHLVNMAKALGYDEIVVKLRRGGTDD